MGTLRFVLALSVALCHVGTVWGYFMMNGVISVQCFYIVSGFLMALILSTKYDGTTRQGRWLFYSSRALRIFVPYWTVMLATLAIGLAAFVVFGAWMLSPIRVVALGPPLTWPAWVYALWTNVFILGMDASHWLALRDGALSFRGSPNVGTLNVLPQAWTISLELIF